MEFSLANLPSVELCIRRAVSKSQSEGKGGDIWDGPFLRRSKREGGSKREAFLKSQYKPSKSWRGTEKRTTFEERLFGQHDFKSVLT